jgi:hypothetical protein
LGVGVGVGGGGGTTLQSESVMGTQSPEPLAESFVQCVVAPEGHGHENSFWPPSEWSRRRQCVIFEKSNDGSLVAASWFIFSSMSVNAQFEAEAGMGPRISFSAT